MDRQLLEASKTGDLETVKVGTHSEGTEMEAWSSSKTFNFKMMMTNKITEKNQMEISETLILLFVNAYKSDTELYKSLHHLEAHLANHYHSFLECLNTQNYWWEIHKAPQTLFKTNKPLCMLGKNRYLMGVLLSLLKKASTKRMANAGASHHN